MTSKKVECSSDNRNSLNVEQQKNAWNSGSENERTDEKCFTQILSPLKLSSAVFGMFVVEKTGSRDNDNRSGNLQKLSKIFQSSILYNILICMIFVLNACRHAVAFWMKKGNEDITFRIISGFWLGMSTINVLLMIKSSHRKFGNFRCLIMNLEEKVLPLYEECHVTYPRAKLRARMKIVLVVIWTIISITAISMVIVYFVRITPVLESMRALFISPFEVSNGLIIVTFCSQILVSVAWGVPVAYCLVLCLALKYGFEAMNTRFKAILTNDGAVLTDEFSRFRRIHLELCKCVNLIDKDLTYVFANWYIINVPQSCFISYILLNREMDPISIGLLLFWLVTGIAIVLVTSSFAASLHVEVSYC